MPGGGRRRRRGRSAWSAPRGRCGRCSRCLDDPHEEVRAAAVEALGHLGDPGCVPALLRALPDASRHQRARVVESIRELGPSVAHALVAHARVHPDDLGHRRRADRLHRRGERRRRSAGVVEPRRCPRCGPPRCRRSARSGSTTAPTTTCCARSATPMSAVRAMAARALGPVAPRRRRAVPGPAPRRRMAGRRARRHGAADARPVGRARAGGAAGRARPRRGAGAADAVGAAVAARGRGRGMRALVVWVLLAFEQFVLLYFFAINTSYLVCSVLAFFQPAPAPPPLDDARARSRWCSRRRRRASA